MEQIKGLTRFQNAQVSPVNIATEQSGVANKVMPSARFAKAINAPQNAQNRSSILAGLPTATQSYLNNQQGISGNFIVPNNDVVPSTVLSSNLTATDLFQKRSQMESEQRAAQASSDSLNKVLGNAESVASGTNYSDPDSFVRSLVFDDQPTELEQQQKGSVGKIEGILSGLLGKGKRTLALEAEAGVPQMQKELMDLNKQIAKTKAEYDKTAVGIQNEAGQTVLGAESRLTPLARQQAADLGALSSMAQAYQGNIALAMDIAERTVALEYGDIEQAIQNEMTMLEARKPLLEGEEKKRAEKVSLALQLRQEKVNEEKSNRETVMQLAIEAAKNGAPASLVASATKMSDPFKVIDVLSGYMSDPVDALMKQAQLSKLQAEAKKAQLENGVDQEAQSELLATMNLAGQLLNDPNLGSISGVQVKSFIAGTEAQRTKAQYEQLKGLLSLENRQKLKGSGAISDFEARTLERAASSLSRSMSDKDFRKELVAVRGALSSAAGVPTKVKIIFGDQSKVVLTTRAGIDSAISDGAVIEYVE